MELTKAVEKFITYLKINRNSSPKTIEQYEFHLFKFLAYLNPEIEKQINHKLVFISSPTNPTEIRQRNEQKKILYELIDWDLKDIDIDLINNFRFSLNEKNIKTLNIKTINAYMITLRAFFKYIKKIQEDWVDPTQIDLIKQEERKVDFLDKEEIIRLFSEVDDSIFWVRDSAIMECIYSTGLRISELVALNIRDINLERQEFAVRWKWWKVRVVYLTGEAKQKIEKYLSLRDDCFSPLFIRHNFDVKNISNLDDKWVRLSRFFITNMIKNYWLKAKILKDISAHTLRHSFATTLLENWADLRAIQELLWHKNITTTQVYTHVTNPQLKEIHKKFHF
ncbi:MAG: hypothetical protein ACD_49C00067G0038 [uncultured bacterium (gcode 4)]|uniref:Tyrosine recombinase XerC n=1 Tax=uncultured bacterium (gcode 4) TaxID=1234023 RepID=K2AW59_9BACT|nr:MAG: hypothetical protein ACD_49C00067G0038 [uncultured bacterium (gcode 4)]